MNLEPDERHTCAGDFRAEKFKFAFEAIAESAIECGVSCVAITWAPDLTRDDYLPKCHFVYADVASNEVVQVLLYELAHQWNEACSVEEQQQIRDQMLPGMKAILGDILRDEEQQS